ncbi:MAG: formylglycine-generating enzyme family protein [Candidatus Cloacimonadota bacterium]|jgi:sulfatase modifying factor 1|nr:formylglycine-generating enzyme family protein [Candidatus Cloacimonadota bacterium]
MMRIVKAALAVFVFMCAAALLDAQQISNIRVEQDEELGYYRITFDLEGKASETYNIRAVPRKGGRELKAARYLSGEGISQPCTPGRGRQLFWNPLLEGEELQGWQFGLSAVVSYWVYVEGGSFMMGSIHGSKDEKPVHQVTVSPFWIGKYEVTQAEWKEVMDSNPSNWKGDQLPVEQVSWYDAVDYCNKRSIKEGLTPCYSGSGKSITCDWTANGYRLPTEAEWEFAARGGVKSKGYIYSGSNSINSVAWYWDNARKRTHEVGTKDANELGIYDMSGNVYEWCWDWYAKSYYAKSPGLDPRGAGKGSYRGLRGGSWNNFDYYCRVAYRFNNNPDDRYYNIGFRVSRAK